MGGTLVFGLYAYLLPLALYATWLTLAFWDLSRREDLSRAATAGWVAAALLVPYLGVIAYHLAARSPIPAWLRITVVAGGLAAYGVVVLVAALVTGLV